MRKHGRTHQGLTLPELLLGMAVASTVVAGSTGYMIQVIQKNRMAAEVNRFVTALHLARSRAVTLDGRTVLCPSANLRDCGKTGNWESGWMLFESIDRVRDAGEPVIQASRPLEAGIRLTTSNYRKRIVFQQDGSAGGSNASFTFCDTRGRADPRVICLSIAGRPRLTTTRCDGKPVEC